MAKEMSKTDTPVRIHLAHRRTRFGAGTSKATASPQDAVAGNFNLSLSYGREDALETSPVSYPWTFPDCFLADLFSGVHRIGTDRLAIVLSDATPGPAIELLTELKPIACMSVLDQREFIFGNGTYKLTAADVIIPASTIQSAAFQTAALCNLSALENYKGAQGNPVIAYAKIRPAKHLRGISSITLELSQGIFTFANARSAPRPPK